MATDTVPEMEHDRLIRDVRELAPAPATRPLADSTRARLEADLVAVIDRHGPRARAREQLARMGPAVLVAACLVAAATLGALTITGGNPDGRPAALPVRAEPAAVHALDNLATVALTTATPTVRDDQYVYVRSTVISNDGEFDGPVTLGAPHEREIWLSQAPGATSDAGLIREFGQDWPLWNGYPTPAGPDRPTYQWLSTLPADPDRIIAELSSHQLPGSAQSSDQYTFERIGDIIAEGLVPPRLAEALFQAVTKIPGVTFVDRAEDAIGRTGFGIARTDESDAVTSVWVFRPGSPKPLGVRWYFSGPDSAPRQQALFGATAILERGVADQLGADPGTPVPQRA